MNSTTPSTFYAARLATHEVALRKATGSVGLLSRLRLLVIVAGGIGIYYYRHNETIAWWLAGILTVVFLLLIRMQGLMHGKARILQVKVGLVRQEVAALGGNISQFPAGSEFMDVNHPFSYDLDIFGKGSIYQLLCRCATLDGEKLLAERLSKPADSIDEVLQRQSAVLELSTLPVMLEDFRAAGMLEQEGKSDSQMVRAWLKGEDHFISSHVAKIFGIAMPVISVILIGLSIYQQRFHPLLYLVILINWILLIIYQKKIKIANLQIGRTASLIDKYQHLLTKAAQSSFADAHLQEIGKRAGESVKQIAIFKKLVNTFDSRNNGMVGPLMNTFLLFDIRNLLRLEGWRKTHKTLLLQGMDDMTELDVLMSCAVYAFNNLEHSYPVVSSEEQGISAINIRHPLLKADSAVGNNFTIGQNEHLYLLTGANMTGKSTFIRTVGVSVIFAYIGLPVPASSLRLPLLNIYTSIRVTDSVQEDVSYFKAELNRIKALMTAVQASGSRYLVLLDEPLRGTNSTDKQQGTRAIVETLLKHQVTGIVATHDTGLCTMETVHERGVRNYHFESAITSEGLSFDFKLRNGCSTSNNATVLMRQMGIIADK